MSDELLHAVIESLQLSLFAAQKDANTAADRVAELEAINASLWDETHDAYCAGDCGRLTANGYCRDCMMHGGVNAFDRARLAEGFIAANQARIAELEEYESSYLDVFFGRGRAEARVRELEAQLSASHLTAQRLTSEAVAEEREACAKVAEETNCAGNSESWWAAQTSIAAAIRARGTK